MKKAHNIQWQPAKKGGFIVTAKLGKLGYQEEFKSMPTELDMFLASKSFEINYAGLNEKERQPIEVKPHHMEK